MVLGGRCPYLSFHFLLTWYVLHDFVIDRMVVLIPFQYTVACIVSSRRVCPGCCRYGGTTNCTLMEWLKDNHPAVFTHYRSLINQPDIDSFIKDMVVLETMLECCINSLSICDLLGSEGINFVLIAMIGKHMV